MLTIRQYRTLRHARECDDRMLTERRMTPAGRFWIAYALALVCLIGWML